ncbi:hypothetical protein PC129_g14489 [Phytophthora cactorum]|uniref:Uncharacterized protein n=1 Tax=Phytophthora cactorum TaxID=29920 RepID=A0A329SR26_9STRA|nr:hypothetical protein Pcac1_g15048 [Phytophthora cactorum]KAG2810350.1 hypothetical protein PC112_g16093 [Phytophthora cactorum]KAG2811700.1 hypothetical protein PC111_g15127 [Phytophthora cactorum]KAG2851509.1 hypothetical protein PC113_g15839 [Phytophthora cactorum]KAG2899061.1 hypothetical protein PC114_g14030 [Phytophthora cactorum]
MDQISKLLDELAVPLDEVLAFIDARDFDLSSIERQSLQVDPAVIFDDSMGIEDSLELAPDQKPSNDQESKRITTQQPQTGITAAPNTQEAGNNDSHSRSLVRPASSTSSDSPYKERGRVRDRVIRLRAIVKQLEQQLEDLNRMKVRGANDRPQGGNNTLDNKNKAGDLDSGGVAPTGHVHRDVVPVTWHDIAIRQFAARREAEKENSSLRQRLEEQIRVAKRLEHLIRGQL